MTAFIYLVANPFPGFAGAPGYPVDITIAPPERQNRWITLFRSFLAFPALLVSQRARRRPRRGAILGWFVVAR